MSITAKWLLEEMNGSSIHMKETYDMALRGLSSNGYCIAVDFDGTLCKNEFPRIGEANDVIINQIKYLKSIGFQIILWTCRGGKLLEQAVKWCTTKGLVFDSVNENTPERIKKWGNDSRKVGADEYWDDKAITVEC